MKKLVLFVLFPIAIYSSGQKKADETKVIVLKTGAKINASITINQQISAPVKSSSISNSVNLIEVIDEDSTNYKLSSQIVTINSNGDRGQINYNSESNSPDDLSKARTLKKLLLLNKRTGKFKIQPSLDSLKNEENDYYENNVWAQFGTKVLESAFLLIPAGKANGSSWTETDSSANFKSNIKYTILNTYKDSTKVGFKGDYSATNINTVHGMDVLSNSNANVYGEMWVDNKNNLVLKKNTTENCDTKITVMGQTSTAMSTIETVNIYLLN
jgi:hypothetical protein